MSPGEHVMDTRFFTGDTWRLVRHISENVMDMFNVTCYDMSGENQVHSLNGIL